MASPMAAPLVSRARSHARASAASMAARSPRQTSGATRGSPLLAVDDVEGAIGALHQSLHTRFSGGEFVRRGAKILNAFLEQCECAREVDAVALQLLGDFLEAADALLEC